jgi:hypothetical protein
VDRFLGHPELVSKPSLSAIGRDSGGKPARRQVESQHPNAIQVRRDFGRTRVTGRRRNLVMEFVQVNDDLRDLLPVVIEGASSTKETVST